MSDENPVNPAEVPVFTGDLHELDSRVTLISSGGAAIASTAGDVHSSFGGLSAFYKAPEADQLFATTKPVSDLGLKLSQDICTISGALGQYSKDAAPIAKKLDDLKTQAETFKAMADSHHDWRQDEDKVKENNNRRNDIADAWTQFQAVERDAYAKIVALVGGKPLRVNDGSNADDMYGYNAKDLKDSKDLPWGSAVDRDIPWWDLPDQVIEFGKGVIIDGVWGTIKGLGTLVGVDGWDACKQAWTGLAKLATGLAIMSVPGVGPLFFAIPDKDLPPWIRDSRTAMKETGKALLAWDQWGSNPSRAAGSVTFNVLTTVFTGGEAGAVEGAGKAGAVSKALSVAGKVGKAIDPMTYVFKGAGFGISKVSDVMKGLKGITDFKVPGINLDHAVSLPEGAVKLPDGSFKLPPGAEIPEGAIKGADDTIKLPEGTKELPPGTVKFEHGGKTEYVDPHGNVYDESGKIHPGEDAPKELPGDHPGSTPDHPVKPNGPDPLHTPAKAKVPEMAGVGGRDGVIKLGSDISDPFKVPDHVPEHLTGGGHDLTPGGHAPDHTPGGHVPDHTPGGHAPEGPNASHEPPGHNDGPGHDGNGGHDGNSDHTGGGDHNTGGHDGGSGDHTGGGHDGGGHDGGAGTGGHPSSDEPLGNRPDGSWEGEKGLKLNPEANAAAEKFMQESATHEPRVTEAVQDVAGKVDNGKLIGLEYRLKGADSLKRKLATDLAGKSRLKPEVAIAKIKDSVRYTLEVPADNYAHGVTQAVEDLQKRGFENITFRNTWGAAGYKGINSTWRDAVTGQKFELQFHTADSFKAKMDGHALYEKQRLPGLSPEEIKGIKAEQADHFGKVPVPEGAADIKLPTHDPIHEIPTTPHEPDGTGHNPGTEHPKPDGGHTPGDHNGGDHTGDHTAGDHSSGDHTPSSHDGTPGSGTGDHPAAPNTGDHGWGRPPTEDRPFQRGGETEKKIRDLLPGPKPKPNDLTRAIENLSTHPAGQETADLIASGRFKGMENFDQVVGSLSQKDKMSGGIEQLRLADRLERSGVTDIRFEMKEGMEIKPGVVAGPKTDMDVMAHDRDGTIFGYQFKEIANPKKVADKIWNQKVQLTESGADVKVFVVDTKGSMADMLASGVEKDLARIYKEHDLLVVLRTEDGTLLSPPGARFMPGGQP